MDDHHEGLLLEYRGDSRSGDISVDLGCAVQEMGLMAAERMAKL